ncbi:MAG: TadG family pilus assembly protein [Shinella sp.]|nr:TadG family pilus assembly protein [Shinella sp.]
MRRSFLFRRLAAERRGNVATLAAISMPLVLMSTALGVDYGYLTVQQRELQMEADLAAIAAAADLNRSGQTLAAHFAASNLKFDVTDADGIVIPAGLSASAGREPAGKASIEKGIYTANPALRPEDRFAAATSPADAVQVRLERDATMFIAPIFAHQPPRLSATGTAARPKFAAFSIGSRLASLNDGVLNALLGQLLGTKIALNVMDYRSLIDADIDVRPFLSSLATRLNLTAVSYEDVLETELTIPQLLSSIRAFHGISNAAKSALRVLEQATAKAGAKLPLSRILNLDPKKSLRIDTGGDWGMRVNALQVVTAAASLANGENQVALGVNAGLPGLAGVSVRLAIGEPPVETPSHRLGAPGSAVRTAQTRLAVDISIDGLALLLGLRIHLPIYIEVAASEAKLADIRCYGGSPSNASVSIDTVPGVAEIAIGKVDPKVLSNFSSEARVQRATLIDSLLLKVSGMAHVEAKELTPIRLPFSPTEIADGRMKSASTSTVVTSLTQSLLRNLDLRVDLLFLSLGTKELTSALADLLGLLTPQIDQLLYNLLLVVGVRIGEADIRVTSVQCQRPVLVQ